MWDRVVLGHILDHTQGMQPSQRRFGKTYAAVELVKRVNGVLLCHNHVHARQVAKEYSVPTDSIQTYMPQGDTRPVVIDQDAALFTMRRLLDQTYSLEKVAFQAQEAAKEIGVKYDDLRTRSEALLRAAEDLIDATENRQLVDLSPLYKAIAAFKGEACKTSEP